MDVWTFLSFVAEVVSRLWGEAMLAVGPVTPRVVIAGACLLMAVLFLVLARRSRGTVVSATRIEPSASRRVTKRRMRKLSANEAFAAHAREQSDEFEGEPGQLPALNIFASGNEPQGPSLVVASTPREIVAKLEAKRGSRVIAIVHRENMERGYLDVADLEDTLTAIRKTPRNKPLDIIIHSPGGHIRVAQQIARAIKSHPARTTVFVPYFALGSTTFMAFAADEIVMSAHAALSPVDPFAGAGPASSVLKGIKNKPIAKIEDETVICADIAQKLLNEAKRVTCELMENKDDHDGVCRMADELVSGKFSRDRAITASSASMLGLNVSIDMPSEVFDLIRSCRRGHEHDTSVTFLDHDASEPKAVPAFHDRTRNALAIGAFDSGVMHLRERAKGQAPRQATTMTSKSTWLAQSGGQLPEASVERAKGLIRRIEQERGSRVICIIHGENMENEAFNFDDLEDVLSAIVASDTSKPLDIVLHTQGGNSFTGRQIARAIKSHKARKTVFVPYYAMSAGSRISLAADQIVMGEQATLGPIDTQLYGWPAPSILQLLNVKPLESISDEFLILAEEARKIMAEGRSSACDLLQGTYSNDGSCLIADEMISGKWTHGFPITANVAQELGLNVSTNLPDVFYDLVRCFRHADGSDPSVIFIAR